MRFTKLLFATLLLCLFACQDKVKELPGAPPISNEEKPKVPIFSSDNKDLKRVNSLDKYRDSLSYSIGMYLGSSFDKQNLKVNPQKMAQGYQDVIKNQAGLSHKAATNYLNKVKNIQTYRRKAKPGEYPFPLSLDSVSYAIGADMGYQQKGTNYELNVNSFHQGIVDFQTGVRPKVSQQEQTNYMGLFFKGMKSVIKERNKGKTSQIAEEELAYFKKNRSTPGVVSMPSGLQYQIIKTGTGTNVIYSDKVLLHYEAKDLTGKVLDNKFKKGLPTKVSVSNMIPGWVEGLQMMNKGAKFRFFVPSKLAYGEDGYQNIPPNTALIYEIEIVEILKN